MASIVQKSDDRPKLTRGRGTPLAGASPRTTVMLSRAWKPRKRVSPAADLAEEIRRVHRYFDPPPDQEGVDGKPG